MRVCAMACAGKFCSRVHVCSYPLSHLKLSRPPSPAHIHESTNARTRTRSLHSAPTHPMYARNRFVLLNRRKLPDAENTVEGVVQVNRLETRMDIESNKMVYVEGTEDLLYRPRPDAAPLCACVGVGGCVSVCVYVCVCVRVSTHLLPYALTHLLSQSLARSPIPIHRRRASRRVGLRRAGSVASASSGRSNT